MSGTASWLNSNFAWRVIQGRPLLAIGISAGLVSTVLWPAHWWLTRCILGWDTACLVYLLLAARMFGTDQGARMAIDAQRDREGEWTIFVVTICATLASLGAVLGEFSATKDAQIAVRGLHTALVAVTLLLSWLMTHTLFAVRYAHEYYDAVPPGTAGEKPSVSGGSFAGGLDFPGDQPPDYSDFFYFSLVLGMTFQVSDVQITSRHLRRLATVHGLLGFLFNTIILALSVNIGASLI